MLRGGLAILVLVQLLVAPGWAAPGGEELFTRKGCIACHLLKGHPDAVGTMGPDLSKLYKAKPPVDRAALIAYLRDPQSQRPGTAKPSLWLTQAEAEAITAYLLTQRTANRR